MKNTELEEIVNSKLQVKLYKDCSLNGLQVEGKRKISSIISGVSICQELIDYAVKKQADAIIVHHGCFWNKSNIVISGVQKKRLKTILTNNINLFAWHLPLDIHTTFGNNFYIGKKLSFIHKGNLSNIVSWGVPNKCITKKDLLNTIKKVFCREPFYLFGNKSKYVYKVAWCSGKGQKFIDIAGKFGVDTFITGEVSEETIYLAREYRLNFFSIGHYASEVFGIKALGEWISKQYNLEVKFLDVFNPI